MQEYEPIKKILDRERIRTDLKNRLLSKSYFLGGWTILLLVPYLLMYLAFYNVVENTIIVHIVFLTLLAVLAIPFVKHLRPILTLARMRNDNYLFVEDEIDFIKENVIKGMHLVLRSRSLRWEPILEHAIVFKTHGELLVERYQLEGHKGSDKVYVVLSRHKPERVILCYNAEQYELHM